MRLSEIILRDTRANQPAATDVPAGTLFCVTDEDDIVERSDAATWESYSPAAVVGGITTLTGDVTAGPGSGSQAATIPNNTVTYGKMQDVTATSRILGRKTAAAGDIEECTLSEILDFIGSAAQGDILYRGAASWARLGAGTNGHFLKTQGAGADPVWAAAGGGGDWTGTLIKTVDDTVTNSATLTNDSELLFAVTAGLYLVEFQIWHAESAFSNFKFALTFPALANVNQCTGYYLTYSTGGSIIQTAAAAGNTTTWPGASGTTVGEASLNADYGISGVIQLVASGAGNVNFQFAQGSANPGNTAKLKIGSMLRYKKLA